MHPLKTYQGRFSWFWIGKGIGNDPLASESRRERLRGCVQEMLCSIRATVPVALEREFDLRSVFADTIMWTAETFFALLTDALIQFFTAFVATWAATVFIQIPTIAATLTDAICQLLFAVIAEATGTGAAREGTNVANLIHWIHFFLTFIHQMAAWEIVAIQNMWSLVPIFNEVFSAK